MLYGGYRVVACKASPVRKEDAVAQIGEEYYKTLQDAFDMSSKDNENPSDIIVLKSITNENVTLETEHYVKLHLQGNTISYNSTGNASEYGIINNGNIEIVDEGTISFTDCKCIKNIGTLKISAGKIKGNSSIGESNLIENTGTLEVAGGELTGTFSNSSNGYTNIVNNSSTTSNLILSSGTIFNDNSMGSALRNSGKVKMTGGTINGGGATAISYINGTIDIVDGIVTSGGSGILNVEGGLPEEKVLTLGVNDGTKPNNTSPEINVNIENGTDKFKVNYYDGYVIGNPPFADLENVHIIDGFRINISNESNGMQKATLEEKLSANKPELFTGMTPIIFDEQGNVETVDADNVNWYSYNSQGEYKNDGRTSRWANAKTADGSQWVWIPRYAYKIVEKPENKFIEGGKVDVLFMKGTSSDTYITEDGQEVKGLPDGYIVHPAFTDESKIGYKNGGWDAELTGIWVAKYEAGYAGVDEVKDTTKIVTSSVKYSTTYNYPLGSQNNAYMTYPVFVPNAISYASSTIGDYFSLATVLTEENNPYGLISDETDSHMMKNSEWGAVVFLTQSQYGRNGVEVQPNTRLSDAKYSSVGGATGYGNLNIKEDKFNTENGKLSSSTGNLYGVYDFSGGACEYTAGYINNGSIVTQMYGGSLVKSSNNKSTKYVSVYNSTEIDSNESNYSETTNIERKGEAIWETSRTGKYINDSWFSDYGTFPNDKYPFTSRGSYYAATKPEYIGIFGFQNESGYAYTNFSFRPVLCKPSKANIIPNKPELLEGMKPIIFDSNGNAQDIAVDDPFWYNYESQGELGIDGKTSKWANARTEDGSQWVWIPRYAYKILSNPQDNTTSGGNIDVIFLKGKSIDTYIDERGIEHKLPDDYIVHPAFTDESITNFENGGWDAELTGIWVAKYEAGFAGKGDIESTTEKKDSSLSYSTLISSSILGETQNIYGTIAENETKIPYPVFVPNAYSYNYISIGDCFRISKVLNEKNNPYGFNNASTDTHLMKNSEWGAVAYLTQSQYGRNGIEVSPNKKDANVDLINGVTGYGDNTDSNEGKFNTENGKCASSTGNLYGVYDLNGGNEEYVSGYLNNSNSYLEKYGKALTDEAVTMSSRYVSLYNIGTNDTQSENYSTSLNANRKGEAIWETSKIGNSKTDSWFGDNSSFAYSSMPFLLRGGICSDTDTKSGIFSFDCGVGYANTNFGFRAVAIKSGTLDKKVNKPEVYTGMTPITFDDKGTVIEITEDDPSWYNYESQGNFGTDGKTSKWANAKTEDGSQWVWIPRYAYKILNEPNDYTTQGGEIDILFMKGTSSTTYIDDNGQECEGLPEGYIVHPAFTNESITNGYGNGGWDEELTGIWVAKYEAGYPGIGEVKNTTFRKDSNYVKNKYYTNAYGSSSTNKIVYPVFVPNAYSYNLLTVGDNYKISALITDGAGSYGLKANETNSHLIKDSEWGAVAYLTQSKYGRNGVEVQPNTRDLNDNKNYIYSVTGYGNKNNKDDKFNTENGKLSSTTGNLYGIYDMNGGMTEYLAGLLDVNNEVIDTYGKLLKIATNNKSSKYVTLYKASTSQTNNYSINNGKVGQAIFETSKKGSGNTSWFSGDSYFLFYDRPFACRNNLFDFSNTTGNGFTDVTFRAVLCKSSGKSTEGIPNAPELLYGMTPVKFNENGEMIKTTENDPSWYDYKDLGSYKEDKKQARWANAMTEDGSLWVWIPRFAYAVNSQPNSENESGMINIYFVKGTGTSTFINENGVEYNIQSGYKVHPAFRDESSTGYKNGGWDRELTGFWVSKYEASKPDVNEEQKVNLSGKIYPKFVPNKNSYTNISISDAYSIAKSLTETSNPYNIDEINVDSHLIKNSEWGAIAYLTHSEYGRNGIELEENLTGITGTGSDLPYNSKGEQNASTTGNLYGVYDLNGGVSEFVSGYLNNNDSNLNTNGNLLVNQANGISNKYISVYNVSDNGDTSQNNYNEELNKARVGEAIWETSSTASGEKAWFGDKLSFAQTSKPFMTRGGDKSTNDTTSGIFNLNNASGEGSLENGFRVILCKNDDIDTVPNEPELLDGMTPIIYEEDGTPKETTIEDENWYSYIGQGEYKTDGKTSKWANAKTEDGSQWVWIPRFAYKISIKPEYISHYTIMGYKDGGKIDILFLKDDTDDTYVDTKGNTYKGLPNGYIVHPAFKDESSNGFANGGWDSELRGIWVAKYEAGYAEFGDVKDTTKKVDSNYFYSKASDNAYGYVSKYSTKIPYPVFVPNAYSITIGIADSYKISRAIAQKGNPYGLNPLTTDSHQMKNSEWGAVAYLTQSKYGRNGIEVSANLRQINEGENSLNAITGYSNLDTEEDRFNTENGKLASSTGNLYGVYDLSAGNAESTSGYINNGSQYLTEFGNYMINIANGVSNRYISVYNSSYSDSINKLRKGEAIWETSKNGFSSSGWFKDCSVFPSGNQAFTLRGEFCLEKNFVTGIFAYRGIEGGNYNEGYRPVLCRDEVSEKNAEAKIGSIYYKTLQDAFDAASETEYTEITLLKDIVTENATLANGKKARLNLNNKHIKGVDYFAITNEGELEVLGKGEVTSLIGSAIYNIGTLTLDSDCKLVNSDLPVVTLTNTGIVNVKHATIECNTQSYAINCTSTSAELNIYEGANIISESAGIRIMGKLEMYDGLVSASNSAAIEFENGTVDIYGGIITGETGISYASSSIEKVVNIGRNDDIVHTDYPIIKGKRVGVNNQFDKYSVNFYDGCVEGEKQFDNIDKVGIPEGYSIVLKDKKVFLSSVNDEPNKPQLLEGMKPIKFNSSGDEIITIQDDPDWYNYENQGEYKTDSRTSRWANARTEDGSQWVWIPRFAYKIDYGDSYDKSVESKIDVIFLKESSTDMFVDIDGQNHLLPPGYTVHPAFTNETSTNHANGGWNKELRGIWVAKYEAGYAETGNVQNTTKEESNVIYSGINNDSNIYGELIKDTTKLMYPIFMPNAYSYNKINISDAYSLCRALTENNNPYGLNPEFADTHMMKNSEWGAVAYLTQSKYGRNGIEVSQNKKNINNDESLVSSVTGYGIGTSDTYDTESGQLASSTGNLYGIYDLNGGNYEYMSGYIVDTPTDSEGKKLVSESNNSSTRYISLYNSSYYDYTNSLRKGEAIWETSNGSGGSYGWFDDVSIFSSTSDNYFLTRGGFNGTDEPKSGIFGFESTNGVSGNINSGFRAVCIKDYASEEEGVAKIGDKYYYKLQEAFEDADAEKVTTIDLLKDIEDEIITYENSNGNVILNLNGHTVKNQEKITITNKGNLTIVGQGGSIISEENKTINNIGTLKLMDNVTVITTSTRNAIENTGNIVAQDTIITAGTETSSLSNGINSSSTQASVELKNTTITSNWYGIKSDGTLIIREGTTITAKQGAILFSSGTIDLIDCKLTGKYGVYCSVSETDSNRLLNIGLDDNNVKTDSPLIEATSTAVYNGSNKFKVNFYDGCIKGTTIFNDKDLVNVPDEYEILYENNQATLKRIDTQ